MPPRTLASLAHALSAATDLDAAFVALAEGLAETDRDAHIALLRLDAKSGLLRERLLVAEGRIEREGLDTSIEQFPKRAGQTIAAGGIFADLADESAEFAQNDAEPDPSELWTDILR